VVAEIVNAVNPSSVGRKVLDATLGVHPQAPVPPYRSNTVRKQLKSRPQPAARAEPRARPRQGGPVRDLLRQSQRAADRARSGACFEHNGIEVAIAEQENCCGMPKLELGDLQAVSD
jgi:glycerol-3-phosphate dehydrogenase subunit C